MRVVLLAFLPMLLTAGEKKFELVGKVQPAARTVLSLSSTETPLVVSTDANPSGDFHFKRLPAGSYTLIAFVVGRGEVRTTVVVGPGTATDNGRVRMNVDSSLAVLSPDRGAIVRVKEMSVPASARREYTLAERALGRADSSRAEQHLLRAVEIWPEFAAAWNNLGTIAYKTRRLNDAERFFRRAHKADEEMYEPLVNLAGVLLNLQNFDEARTLNEQAVERKPADALANAQLGQAYLRLNQLQLAEKHLQIARQLDPKHFSTPQVLLAELYLRKNDKRKAAEQLADLLKHHPDWPDKEKVRNTVRLWSQ